MRTLPDSSLDALSRTGVGLKEGFSDCLKSFVEGDSRGVLMPIIINQELEEKLERELKM